MPAAARSQATYEAEGPPFPPLCLSYTNSYSLGKHPSWNFPQILEPYCIIHGNQQEVIWEAEGDLGLMVSDARNGAGVGGDSTAIGLHWKGPQHPVSDKQCPRRQMYLSKLSLVRHHKEKQLLFLRKH